MEDDTTEIDISEALAQVTLSNVLASDSGSPLADAADLLISTVLNDPDWQSVVEGWPSNELRALARIFPKGAAAVALRRIAELEDLA